MQHKVFQLIDRDQFSSKSLNKHPIKQYGKLGDRWGKLKHADPLA
jgi:hypothetical protein